MEIPHHGRNPFRSTSGCWVCRLRRKKCDENHPVCDTCASLSITCCYSQEKPEWMDNGSRQEAMAEQIKRQIKERTYRRRVGIQSAVIIPANDLMRQTRSCRINPTPPTLVDSPESGESRRDCTHVNKPPCSSIAAGRSDMVLLTFYLEHVFPFLFPFYHPSALEGGKAWILELTMSAPVIRQAALCQSSYFFSLAHGTASSDEAWEAVLSQTRDAFEVLGRSLQVIESSSVPEHLHGAARVMSSIMQVQRFEIQVLSFDNCRAHLNGALALFKKLVGSVDSADLTCIRQQFEAVFDNLGPASWIPCPSVHVPSAEQAAFRFSSALLLFDDIIASTALQEEPRLYEYHRALLYDADNAPGAPIDFEGVVGCQNWALRQIGEIAVLDAWKQKCKRAGNLDVMELVRQAMSIKESLQLGLSQLQADSAGSHIETSVLSDILTTNEFRTSTENAGHTSSVTRIWAHAAFIYLSLVVSGWQPASVDVRFHVSQIIRSLSEISPTALLRTLVWPFCVAGCLAESDQEALLRGIAEGLRPSNVFGTVRKALDIMENVWRNRDVVDTANRDLASCFGSQGELVLLV